MDKQREDITDAFTVWSNTSPRYEENNEPC